MGCGSSSAIDTAPRGQGTRKAYAAPAPVPAPAAAPAPAEASHLDELPMNKPLTKWADKHVRRWLSSLPAALLVYVDVLTSPGGLVLHWSEEMLVEAGVSNMFHRQQLLEYAKQLVAQILHRQKEPGGGAKDTHQLDKYQSQATAASTGSSVRSSHSLQWQSVPQPPALAAIKTASMSRSSSTASAPTILEECESAASPSCGDAGSPARRAMSVPEREVKRREEDAGQKRVDLAFTGGKAICMALRAALPWPGDVAAELLLVLIDQSATAVVNGRNWAALNERSLDLLQLLGANTALQAQMQTYRRIVDALTALLKRTQELYKEFAERHWMLRLLAAKGDAATFHDILAELGELVADATLGVSAQTSVQMDEVLTRLSQQAVYEDEAGSILSAIGGLGGMDAVLADPTRLAELASKMSTSSQLTLKQLQQGAALLEVHMGEGVHSLILQPQLRVFWRKCFAGQRQVEWALFWSAFPDELRRVPVDATVIDAIKELLSDGRRRVAMQHRLGAHAGTSRISVAALRLAVPEQSVLLDIVTELTCLEGPADNCYNPSTMNSINSSCWSSYADDDSRNGLHGRGHRHSSHHHQRRYSYTAQRAPSPLEPRSREERARPNHGVRSSAMQLRLGTHVVSHDGRSPKTLRAPSDFEAMRQAILQAAAMLERAGSAPLPPLPPGSPSSGRSGSSGKDQGGRERGGRKTEGGGGGGSPSPLAGGRERDPSPYNPSPMGRASSTPTQRKASAASSPKAQAVAVGGGDR